MFYDLVNSIVEATTSDMQRKQRSITRLFPTFYDRAKKIADMGGVRLRDKNIDTWFFRVHSGTEDIWYDDVVRFKNIIPILEKLIRDRRLWVKDRSRVDLTKLARSFLDKIDVQLLCSCPADLYWGGHYIRSLGKYDAKYTNPERRPPKVRNPKQYGVICKHLQCVLQVLPFYITTIAQWLKDFYAKEIAKFEEDTKKEYGWLEPAKKELIRRREVEPEET